VLRFVHEADHEMRVELPLIFIDVYDEIGVEVKVEPLQLIILGSVMKIE